MDCSMPGFPILQTPRAYPNSSPLNWWYYPTVSSSASPFFCLQPFPASGCFPVSWLSPSGGQSIEASASILPVNIQGWFPLWLTSLLSLQSKGLSRVFSSTTVQKPQFLTTNISWYECATVCLTIYSLKDVWVVSDLGKTEHPPAREWS